MTAAAERQDQNTIHTENTAGVVPRPTLLIDCRYSRDHPRWRVDENEAGEVSSIVLTLEQLNANGVLEYLLVRRVLVDDGVLFDSRGVFLH